MCLHQNHRKPYTVGTSHLPERSDPCTFVSGNILICAFLHFWYTCHYRGARLIPLYKSFTGCVAPWLCYVSAFRIFAFSPFSTLITACSWTLGFHVLLLYVSQSFKTEDQFMSSVNNPKHLCSLLYPVCSPFNLESLTNKGWSKDSCFCL